MATPVDLDFDESDLVPDLPKYSPELSVVKVDGLVVLKIIKHAAERPRLTGSLLGLDVYDALEVTNCFGLPDPNPEEGELRVDAEEYHLRMMRKLREINADDNIVGWYQCTTMGTVVTPALVEWQYRFQSQDAFSKAVVLVYDSELTKRGSLWLKAFRLTDQFMEEYKEGKFTAEHLGDRHLDSSKIVQELPVQITNPHLLQGLVYQLRRTQPELSAFDTLDLSMQPFLESQLDMLCETVDSITQEQQYLLGVERQAARQKAVAAQHRQRKLLESDGKSASQQQQQAQAQGEVSLDERIPEPSRFNSLIHAGQINNYCTLINRFAGHSLSKLYLAGSMHQK